MGSGKILKRVLALFMAIALIFSNFFGIWTYDVSAAKTVSITKVKLNRSSATLTKGSSIYLKATVTPTNATSKKVKWTSSNKSVATVYSSGRVHAKKAGKTTIKATVGNKSAYCRVTVKNEIAVKKVKLNKSIISAMPGDVITVKGTVLPTNATNKNLKWKSSDARIASVSSKGVVKAKRVGTAKITVQSVSGDKQATCMVTVKNSTVAVSSVSINVSTVNMEIAEKIKLLASVLPINATNKAVVWSSSDSSVASVDSVTGEVTAISSGEAIITVTTKNENEKATCKIIVNEEESTTEKVEDEESATEQTGTEEPTTENIAIEEPTTEEVTTEEPTVAVSGISLNKNTMTLARDTEEFLTATVAPNNATNKEVQWSSSNTTVATVDDIGRVEAIGKGTATITAKTEDGGIAATCTVTVNIPITDIQITGDKELAFEYAENDKPTYQCTTKILPADAENQNVTWSSSNPDVATVDASGNITIIERGTATITVKTVDGAKTDSVNVYVYKDATQWASDKWYRFLPYTNTDLVMSVNGTSPTNSTEVVLSKNGEDTNQVWKFSKSANVSGKLEIVPKCGNGKYTLNATNNLMDVWEVGKKVTTSTWEILKLWDNDYTYFIRMTGTDYVLAINSATTGSQLVLKKLNPFDATQKWMTYNTAPIAVSGVTLNKKAVTLNINATTTLTATVVPSDATNPVVNWSSTNTTVATVDKKGKVKAVNGGTAKIIAKTADGEISAECIVTVNVPLNKIAFDKTKIALEFESNIKCIPTFLPSNASNKDVTWSSSDPSKVTVDDSGVITAVERGSAEITVKSKVDDNIKSTIKVYVYKDATKYTISESNQWRNFKLSKDTSLAISLASTSVTNGMKVQLLQYKDGNAQLWKVSKSTKKTDKSELTPKCANRKFVVNNSNNLISMLTATNVGDNGTWEIIKLWNDHNTFMIRLSGTEYALAASSATKGSQLILKKFDPFDSLQIWKSSVIYSPSGVSITSNNKKVENVALDIGKTFQCTATVSPSNALDKNVTWSSNNTTVATVDASGKITAVARGTAKITVKPVDGGKTASVTVCVYDSKAEARGDVEAGWWLKLKLAKNQNFVMDITGDTIKENAKAVLSADNEANVQLWKMTGKVGAWNIIPRGQTDDGCKLGASSTTEGLGLQLLKSGNINFEWIQLGDANNNYIYALKLAGTNLAVSAPATIKADAQLVLKTFNPFDDSQKWIVEGVKVETDNTDSGTDSSGYTPRLSAPSTTDKKYYSSDNIFYSSGLGMPNCTAYAYGRAYELLGYKPKVSQNDAKTWYGYNKSNGHYSYGSTPKLGAIMCWGASDVTSMGHVAIVEQINSDGTVVVSESDYVLGIVFRTNRINANGSYLPNFQGYIYVCEDFSTIKLWGVEENQTIMTSTQLWAKRFDSDPNHFVEFYLDDTLLTGHLSADNDGYFAFWLDPTRYEDGEHILKVKYTYSNGSSVDTRKIVINKKVMLWGIEDGKKITTKEKLWAKRFDSDSNHYAEFFLDGELLTGHLTSDENGYFSFWLDPSKFKNGTHELMVRYCNTNAAYICSRSIEINYTET